VNLPFVSEDPTTSRSGPVPYTKTLPLVPRETCLLFYNYVARTPPHPLPPACLTPSATSILFVDLHSPLRVSFGRPNFQDLAFVCLCERASHRHRVLPFLCPFARHSGRRDRPFVVLFRSRLARSLLHCLVTNLSTYTPSYPRRTPPTAHLSPGRLSLTILVFTPLSYPVRVSARLGVPL